MFNIFGALFAAQNQLNNAIKNYQKAIKINPSYAQAYNNLGVALQKLNKLDDAIFQYNKAINLKNDFPEAYNNLGNAYLDLNKPENSKCFNFGKFENLEKDSKIICEKLKMPEFPAVAQLYIVEAKAIWPTVAVTIYRATRASILEL